MNLIDYIHKHTIVQVGVAVGDYLCAEVIVDNPIELIEVVECQRENYYISEILWWDNTKIEEGSTIGYGGPKDTRNSDEYFFAETDIVKAFTPLSTFEEILNYIKRVKKDYHTHELYPAFDIKII